MDQSSVALNNKAEADPGVLLLCPFNLTEFSSNHLVGGGQIISLPEIPLFDHCLFNLLTGPRGKTYAFKGSYVWTVTDSGLGPLFQVSALWEGLPGNLDAAVYSPRTRWIYFFKGKGTSLCILPRRASHQRSHQREGELRSF